MDSKPTGGVCVINLPIIFFLIKKMRHVLKIKFGTFKKKTDIPIEFLLPWIYYSLQLLLGFSNICIFSTDSNKSCWSN